MELALPPKEIVAFECYKIQEAKSSNSELPESDEDVAKKKQTCVKLVLNCFHLYDFSDEETEYVVQ